MRHPLYFPPVFVYNLAQHHGSHALVLIAHIRCSANPTPYDEIRPTFLTPVKDPTSDTESIPSPSTSPVLVRRHYGESITNLGKAGFLGKATSVSHWPT